MRLVTGAALAAALLLAGCSTTTEPDEATPVDTSVEDAVELAAEACTGAETTGDALSDEYAAKLREAARLTAEAAYLDPRWRTLADAFTAGIALQGDLRNRQLLPDSYVPDFVSEETLLAECTLAKALLEEIESEEQ